MLPRTHPFGKWSACADGGRFLFTAPPRARLLKNRPVSWWTAAGSPGGRRQTGKSTRQVDISTKSNARLPCPPTALRQRVGALPSRAGLGRILSEQAIDYTSGRLTVRHCRSPGCIRRTALSSQISSFHPVNTIPRCCSLALNEIISILMG